MTEEQVKKGFELTSKINELKEKIKVFNAIIIDPLVISGFSIEVGANNLCSVVRNGMSMSSGLNSVRLIIEAELHDEVDEFSRRVVRIFNKQIKLLEKELKEL